MIPGRLAENCLVFLLGIHIEVRGEM